MACRKTEERLRWRRSKIEPSLVSTALRRMRIGRMLRTESSVGTVKSNVVNKPAARPMATA